MRGYTLEVITVVRLSAAVEKQLKKLPVQVRKKLLAWVVDVEARGLEEVRKVPGFHDEPLSGKRQHQRSIRLNLHWRAIYEVHGDKVKVALVVEVIPHSY